MIAGPCVMCGLTNYALSCGGPTICPSCDCGIFGYQTVDRQRKEIDQLRDHPNHLPIAMVPEGWLFAHLSAIGPNSENIDYEVSLIRPTGRFLVEGDEEVYGRGPNPRAAMLDVIEKATK